MTRHSFWLRPRRHKSFLAVGQKTYLARIAVATGLSGFILFGLPTLMFKLAGGQWKDLCGWINRVANHGWAAMPQPLVIAAVTFLGLMLATSVSDYATRLTEIRNAGLWISNAHPEDCPPPAVIAVVKKILRVEGPLHPVEIRKRVEQGGSWGRPRSLSVVGVMQILRPGGAPAGWLAPHMPGWPYSVPEVPYVPKETVPAAEGSN